MIQEKQVLLKLSNDLSEEAIEVIVEFVQLLLQVTADGGRKRAAGLKPSWKVDPSHRAAIFSHLNKYEHGERVDPDSGAHPFVHMAWRALAIAWQETRANECACVRGQPCDRLLFEGKP